MTFCSINYNSTLRPPLLLMISQFIATRCRNPWLFFRPFGPKKWVIPRSYSQRSLVKYLWVKWTQVLPLFIATGKLQPARQGLVASLSAISRNTRDFV